MLWEHIQKELKLIRSAKEDFCVEVTTELKSTNNYIAREESTVFDCPFLPEGLLFSQITLQYGGVWGMLSVQILNKSWSGWKSKLIRAETKLLGTVILICTEAVDIKMEEKKMYKDELSTMLSYGKKRLWALYLRGSSNHKYNM